MALGRILSISLVRAEDIKYEKGRIKIYTIDVSTRERTIMVDITGELERIVSTSGVKEGICRVFVPHTTAGLTINENADPTVPADILMELNKIVRLTMDTGIPREFRSHIKFSLVGVDLTVFVTAAGFCWAPGRACSFVNLTAPGAGRSLLKSQGNNNQASLILYGVPFPGKYCNLNKSKSQPSKNLFADCTPDWNSWSLCW